MYIRSGRAKKIYGCAACEKTGDIDAIKVYGGEKTKISLRPERALINPSDKMDNIHSGKIEEVIYHGDHTRVRINILGNDQFILKVPKITSQ